VCCEFGVEEEEEGGGGGGRGVVQISFFPANELFLYCFFPAALLLSSMAPPHRTRLASFRRGLSTSSVSKRAMMRGLGPSPMLCPL